MYWIIHTLGSSVGKKLLMALSGLSFIGFLTVHLAGNLTLYGGGAMFNDYAAHLHALGPLLTLAEFSLLGLAVVHVVTGTFLFLQNLRARPVRYAVSNRAGGRTLSSSIMPYTGVMILAFVVFHLLNFSFVDKTGTTIFDIVTGAFADPTYVCLYIVAMLAVALHVRHGFWSLFQTLGVNHPKYMPLIMALSLIFSLLVGIGFGFLPLYIAFMA